MATAPAFLGDFRKGDKVQFCVDNADTTWNAAFYDVLDNDTKTEILSDQAVVQETDAPVQLVWVDFTIDDVFDTDGQRQTTWIEGRTYSVRVKSAIGWPPTDGDSFMTHFRVATEERRAFLGMVEKGKNMYFVHREEERDNLWYDVFDPRDGNKVFANVAMTGPLANLGGGRYFAGQIETEGTDDMAIGRTYWVRVKDLPAEDPNLDWLYSFTVMPRIEANLTRLLAYAGENMVIDNFTYDQAGNILGLRVRLFSNANDADNATSGVTDPEPGEIAALTVSQQHNVPRNVRTFHKSLLEFLSSTFPEEQ